MMRITRAGAATLGLVLLALPTAAQQPRERPPTQESRAPSGAATRELALFAYTLMYTGFGTVFDPGSESHWALADLAVGGGGGVELGLGEVAFALDAAFTRTRYERRTARSGGTVLASGNATIGTFLASARLSRAGLGIPGIPGMGGRGGMGGLGGLATYLTGSAGTLVYWLDDLDGGNPDFTLAAGAGFDYAWSGGRAAFIEWRRFWVFHERESVDSSTANHSRIELGARVPVGS